MENPIGPAAGIYRHYKGQRYRVLGTARHSETLEPLVVYQALYGDYGLWVRPAAMFGETIKRDGRPIARFALEQADGEAASDSRSPCPTPLLDSLP